MKEAGFSEDVRQARRHRPADDPEVHQPLVQPVPRPARQRDLDQRRVVLRQRPEGARRGGEVGRPLASPRSSTSSRCRPRGGCSARHIPMRTAMNEVLRDWYVGDCQAGVDRWNKIFERHGMSDRLRLPDRKFNRGIGMFSSLHFDPQRRAAVGRGMGAPQERVAAGAGGPRIPAQHHGDAGLRARQVRQLHRAARARRQPACRSTSSTSDGPKQ